MATDKETIGKSKSPNKSSGESIPVTGPTTIPASNNGNIAGSLILYANSWQLIETNPTNTKGTMGSLKVIPAKGG